MSSFRPLVAVALVLLPAVAACGAATQNTHDGTTVTLQQPGASAVPSAAPAPSAAPSK